jgi:hypothetical protein
MHKDTLFHTHTHTHAHTQHDYTHQGSEPAQLSSQPLDHRELFAVVNAWRLLKPGGRFRSLLAFTPQHRASYLQMFTIRWVTCRLRNSARARLKCLYVCVCVCVCVCMHESECMRVHVSTSHTHRGTHRHTNTHMHMHAHTFTHTHRHTQKHIDSHTLTHSQAHPSGQYTHPSCPENEPTFEFHSCPLSHAALCSSPKAKCIDLPSLSHTQYLPLVSSNPSHKALDA